METNVGESFAVCNEIFEGLELLKEVVCFQLVGDTSSDQIETFEADAQRRPPAKKGVGRRKSIVLILLIQFLGTLAYIGVEVNMVLFSKYVLRQSNAKAASTASTWMGSVYLFSIVGGFLSDSSLGRYGTCLIFQTILTLGMILCTLVTHFFLLKPHGCGTSEHQCQSHTISTTLVFYLSIYLVALGNGGAEPALATLGNDQFDEDDPNEKGSKESFLSHFYIAMVLGSLSSQSVLVIIENKGHWSLGFFIGTCCGVAALVLLMGGKSFYNRPFHPKGNPLSRIAQVFVACFLKFNIEIPPNGEGLYEHLEMETSSTQRICHTNKFRILDRAAIICQSDKVPISRVANEDQPQVLQNPWRLCTVTQVEEVKCMIKLIPIWLSTTLAAVVFIQTTPLLMEQGSTMQTRLYKNFHYPPASMVAISMVITWIFITFFDKMIDHLAKLMKKELRHPSELQRIGIALAIIIVILIIAAFLEQLRRRFVISGQMESQMSIMWQIPLYVLIGVAESFLYLSQWEFFTSEAPNTLKGTGLSLSMGSSAIGSYMSSIILSTVMHITSKGGKPGWVPRNLNDGRLDLFFFLLAVLTALNMGLYIFFARRYEGRMALSKMDGDIETNQ